MAIVLFIFTFPIDLVTSIPFQKCWQPQTFDLDGLQCGAMVLS